MVLWDFQRRAIEMQCLEQGSDCTALRQRPRGAACGAITNATLYPDRSAVAAQVNSETVGCQRRSALIARHRQR